MQEIYLYNFVKLSTGYDQLGKRFKEYTLRNCKSS